VAVGYTAPNPLVRLAIGGGGGGDDDDGGDGDDPEATPEAIPEAGGLFHRLGTLAYRVREAATIPSRHLAGTKSRVADAQYSVVGQVVAQPYTSTQKSLTVMGGLNLLYFFVQIGVCGDMTLPSPPEP
jgi:hypothetical protein